MCLRQQAFYCFSCICLLSLLFPIFMSNIVCRETEFAGYPLSLESGLLVPQANGAVKITYGQTTILATVVSNTTAKEDSDFFPLRVDYEEKLYAGGFIRSSRFVKRDGRPRDEAVIAARLIDHAIRPLFPSDFMDETQVVLTTLTVDRECDPLLVAMMASSAVLASSNIPWSGPIASVRVGLLKDGQFILNPKVSLFEELDLNLVISYLKDGKVLAMEAEANNVPDEKVLEAIKWGNEQAQPLFAFFENFAKEVASQKYTYQSYALRPELMDSVSAFASDRLRSMLATPVNKVDWADAYAKLREDLYKELEGKFSKNDMNRALEKVEKQTVRLLVLEDGRRADGRSFDQVRSLFIQAGVLPRVHGSALFQRELTQVLTITTLASGSMEQIIQDLYGEHRCRYFHHYNAPSYSTGEAGFMKGAGRREIGHGALAEKALYPILPGREDFPYTIHLVSEVLSQNGSSSMASTCGSSLSLMDAGVPVSEHVGGISVGLMTLPEDQSKYVILTDIAGSEDFAGFMDYKMAGTRSGVTAIQMDTKLPGLPLELFDEIFAKSKAGRLVILEEMYRAISQPRENLSPYAPRITCLMIDPDKIGVVIGSGGKTIKEISEKTGCEVNIEDDGEVQIIATEETADPKAAEEWIAGLVKEVEVGEIYEGVVVKTAEFGAFVRILPGKDGLLHVSEIAHHRVNRVEDELHEGDSVRVKVIRTDRDGKISLSRKELLPMEEDSSPRRGASGRSVRPDRQSKRDYNNRRY